MRCRRCDRPLVPGGRQRRPIPEGHRRHGGRSLCTACVKRASKDGTLADYEPLHRRNADVVADYKAVRSRYKIDVPLRVIAAEMGMKLDALEQALYRARGAGVKM